MHLKNGSQIVRLLIIIIIIFSCQKNIKSKDTNKIDKDIILYENLKDTVFRNSDFLGSIQYISYFDTIKLKNKEDFRLINFYVKISKDTSQSFKIFSKMNRDTFVRDDEDDFTIPIFEINLDTIAKGSYYIDGYIIDELHTKYNNEKTRIRTLETKITHPIYITD